MCVKWLVAAENRTQPEKGLKRKNIVLRNNFRWLSKCTSISCNGSHVKCRNLIFRWKCEKEGHSD